MLRTGTGLANLRIMSPYLHGNESRFNSVQRPFSPSQTEGWLQVIMSGICRTSFKIRISRFLKRNSPKLSDSSSSSRSKGAYESYGKSRFFDAKRSYRRTNSSSSIKPSLWLIRSRFRTFLTAIARATSRRTKSRRLLKTTHCLTFLFPAKNETLDPILLGLRTLSSCISLSMLKVPNDDQLSARGGSRDCTMEALLICTSASYLEILIWYDR